MKKAGHWRMLAAGALVAVLVCGGADRDAVDEGVDHGGSPGSTDGENSLPPPGQIGGGEKDSHISTL